MKKSKMDEADRELRDGMILEELNRGLNYAMVADIFGVTSGTVREIERRAKKYISKKW